MLLIQSNDLVDRTFGSVSQSLRLPDLLRIAASIGDEVHDVEHGERGSFDEASGSWSTIVCFPFDAAYSGPELQRIKWDRLHEQVLYSAL